MLSAIQPNLITGFLSFLFTLLILSYLVGDNPGFRVAVHIFTGISAGYIVVVAFHSIVNMFQPLVSGSNLDRILLVFPLILSLLLLGKTTDRFEWMGRPVVAFMVGVGSAAAIGGAVLGTLFPQIVAVSSMFDLRQTTNFADTAGNPALLPGLFHLITAGFILVGTIVTLIYFQFTVFGKDKLSPDLLPKRQPRKEHRGETKDDVSKSSIEPGSFLGERGRVIGFIALIGQIFIVVTLGTIFSGVLAAALSALVDRIHSLILFIDQVLSVFIA